MGQYLASRPQIIYAALWALQKWWGIMHIDELEVRMAFALPPKRSVLDAVRSIVRFWSAIFLFVKVFVIRQEWYACRHSNLDFTDKKA
jgi:hypothetical protein